MDIRLRFALILYALFALAGVALSQTAFTTGSLARYADSLLSESELVGSSWSIEIAPLRGGAPIYRKDSDRELVPASVTKLMTSAAALEAMGGDFKLTTTFSASRPISIDGTLDGDLHIIAGGDPTAEMKVAKELHVPMLRAIADSLSAHGLKGVGGNIVLRTGPHRLEGAAMGWELADVNDGFAPPVDGFGFNNNVCNLEIQPGAAVGLPALFVSDPPFAPVQIRSAVMTSAGNTAPDIFFQILPQDTSIIVSGSIPLGNRGQFLWVPIQDPAVYYGRALVDEMQRRGIPVDGDIVVDRSGTTLDPSDVVIYAHASPPLAEIISVMNKESDNYLAEYVLRALAFSQSGEGNRHTGTEAVLKFLHKVGVDKREVYLEDGCGIARQNIVSAHALVTLLSTMAGSAVGPVYRSTLSVSGKDGTLESRLSEEGIAGAVQAKTGTMTHVSSLAGYATAQDGSQYAFAILCNNFRTSVPYVRSVQDKIVKRLVEGPR